MFTNRLIVLCAQLFLAGTVISANTSAATFAITLAEIQAEVGVVATFKEVSSANGQCDRLTRTLEYDGSATRFKLTEIFTDSSTGARSTYCISGVHHYYWDSNSGLIEISSDQFDASNNIVPSSKYEPGLLMYSATMVSGDVQHNLVKSVSLKNPTQTATFIASTILARISWPVTVPMGTYSGCYSYDLSINVSWRHVRCPGVGVVAMYLGIPPTRLPSGDVSGGGITAWVRVS